MESKFDFGAEMTLSIEEGSLFYGAGLSWARDEKCFFFFFQKRNSLCISIMPLVWSFSFKKQLDLVNGRVE